MTQNYKWTLRLSLLTIPLLFIAIFFMGGGHGTYMPAAILFPLGLLSSSISENWEIPFFVLAFVQCSLYGFFIDTALRANNNKRLLWLILFIHIGLSITAILWWTNKSSA